jgi:hypothetical protein
LGKYFVSGEIFDALLFTGVFCHPWSRRNLLKNFHVGAH